MKTSEALKKLEDAVKEFDRAYVQFNAALKQVIDSLSNDETHRILSGGLPNE